MAETTIMNVADDFSIPYGAQTHWVCRDDNDDYWAVVRDTTGNLRVYKSINDGVTWLLKKTLTNSDFIGGNPFPTPYFQLINLSGQDKVYLRIVPLTALYNNYSWKFNVTADTNEKGMDGVKMPVSYGDQNIYGCVAWDSVNNRLLVIGFQGSPATDTKYGEINLSTNTFGDVSSVGGADGAQRIAYYISPADGYGYEIKTVGNTMYLHKKNNGASNYGTNLATTTDTWGGSIVLFAGVITDSNGDPITYGCFFDTGNYYIGLQKHDRNDLNTHTVRADFNLGSSAPEIVNMSIDGNNNLYFIYTKGTDKEAYSVKYDWTTFAETKISSDNEGQLAVPEIRVPVASTQMLVTYQATA